MAFQSSAFWLALFLQQIQRRDPLDVALHLLPQTIAGLTWNIVAGLILHKANNTLLHGIGAVSYIIASLLLALMGPDSSYWAFTFPALIINVVGADFQFNVVNVGFPSSFLLPLPAPFPGCPQPDTNPYLVKDVRDAVTPVASARPGWWHLQHHDPPLLYRGSGHIHRRLWIRRP